MSSHVVLLNGVSSVGKGSVAKALQRIASRPMLHVQMDAFLELMPPGTFGHPDGYSFETREDGGKPVTAITSGPILGLAMRGMRAAVAAMADAGADLVVDEVMWDPADLADYRRRLAQHAFHVVGLFAPLEVIEQREQARGDRTRGLARWQYDKVHAEMAYDLELETSVASPETLAGLIKDAFGV
jgi:chloramphenicol 3-O phosphotransferase